MNLSRDSLLWWLIIFGAVVGYLATLPAPVTWTWAQWMQALTAVIGIVAAKLSTSPLSGKNEGVAVSSSTLDKIAKSLPLVLLAAAVLTFSACHAPVTITTPQGHAAYTADQIVVRVNELQNAAIAANQQQALPLATTRAIVEFCVGADKTLAALPSGWQASLLAAWTSTKASLPPTSNVAISSALALVEAAIQGVQP